MCCLFLTLQPTCLLPFASSLLLPQRTLGWGKRLVLPRQGIPEGELGQLIGMEVLELLRGPLSQWTRSYIKPGV